MVCDNIKLHVKYIAKMTNIEETQRKPGKIFSEAEFVIQK